MSKQRLTPLRIVLVHSPLVGTLCWSKLAPLLESRGHEVLVPDLTRSFEDGSPYCEQQIATIAQCARRGSVLVAHSGAGALVAGVDELVPELGGHVFVDAGLPTPGMSWMDTAPKELSSALISMAHDGWLPPWSELNSCPNPQCAKRSSEIAMNCRWRCFTNLVQLPHLGRMPRQHISGSVMRTNAKRIKREPWIGRRPCWNWTI
jgi:hypothetical protein